MVVKETTLVTSLNEIRMIRRRFFFYKVQLPQVVRQEHADVFQNSIHLIDAHINSNRS